MTIVESCRAAQVTGVIAELSITTEQTEAKRFATTTEPLSLVRRPQAIAHFSPSFHKQFQSSTVSAQCNVDFSLRSSTDKRRVLRVHA